MIIKENMSLYYNYSKEKDILFIYATKNLLEKVLSFLKEKGINFDRIACIYGREENIEEILKKYEIKKCYEVEDPSEVKVYYKPRYARKIDVIIFCYDESYESKIKGVISNLSNLTLSDIILGNKELFNLPRVEYVYKNFLNPLFLKLNSSGSLSYEDVKGVFEKVKDSKKRIRVVKESLEALSMAIVSNDAMDGYWKVRRALEDFFNKCIEEEMKKEKVIYIG